MWIFYCGSQLLYSHLNRFIEEIRRRDFGLELSSADSKGHFFVSHHEVLEVLSLQVFSGLLQQEDVRQFRAHHGEKEMRHQNIFFRWWIRKGAPGDEIGLFVR